MAKSRSTKVSPFEDRCALRPPVANGGAMQSFGQFGTVQAAQGWRGNRWFVYPVELAPIGVLPQPALFMPVRPLVAIVPELALPLAAPEPLAPEAAPPPAPAPLLAPLLAKVPDEPLPTAPLVEPVFASPLPAPIPTPAPLGLTLPPAPLTPTLGPVAPAPATGP